MILSPPIFPDSISPHVSHSHLFLFLIIAGLSKHKLQPDKQSNAFSINTDSHEKQKVKGTEWRGVIYSIYFWFQTYFFPQACCLISIKSSRLLSAFASLFSCYSTKTLKEFKKKSIGLEKNLFFLFYSSGFKEIDICTKYRKEV